MLNFIINFILGLFPEVIYFTLFLIYTKKYKNNRIKLFLLLLIGYVTLKTMLTKNIYFQILFTIYVPIILKVLYKDKFHISDLFVFVYASLNLILCTLIVLPIHYFFRKYWLTYIISRFFMFFSLFILKNKLNKVYIYFISQWNRNYEHPNKIKAITIRQVCVVSLNVMIFILNLGIQYMINIIGS
jgi:hypothetical protein